MITMEKNSMFIKNFIKKSMISQMLNHSKVKKDKNVEKKDLYIEIEEAILRKDGQTIRELSAVITSMWIENSKLALQLIK
nr:hypothetical protein DSAG12_00181 [Candidatus Prometheoarchaeum syntrophicum]